MKRLAGVTAALVLGVLSLAGTAGATQPYMERDVQGPGHACRRRDVQLPSPPPAPRPRRSLVMRRMSGSLLTTPAAP
jgi:hypothetical protein